VVYLAGQILLFMLVALVVGAMLAWVFLIGPLRRQTRSARALVLARAGVGGAAEVGSPPGVPAAGVGEGLADDSLAGTVPSSRRDRDAGSGSFPRPAASPPDRRPGADQNALVSDLAARLRRMSDESALERAELAARLATAEQQAAEAEQRVSTAERQVGLAADRIVELESALRTAADDRSVEAAPEFGAAPVDVGLVGGVPAGGELAAGELDDATSTGGGRVPAVSPTALSREADLPRSRLADAERRSATFSSRLAMARSEARDAQRQVAVVTTRLDRRQAEWAAERVRLLARLEGAGVALTELDHAGASARASAPAATRPAPAQTPHQFLTRPASEAAVAASADETTFGVARGEGPVTGTLTALREPELGPRPGEFDSDRLDDRVGVAALAGFDTVDEVTGDIDVRRAASLLGVFPPPRGRVPRTDNLKEIVGVGPMVEQRLRMLGVTTFRQLATMNQAAAAELARQLEGFGDRIEADDWVGQARVLHLRHYRGEE
jgi:ribosome-binding protein aMBF1 (putative translation factor)